MLVWSIGFLFSAALVAMTASSVLRTASSAVGGVAQQAMQQTSGVPGVDQLLRPARPSPDAQAADVRAEVGRIIANAVTEGQLNDNDRRYLAQVVAARTGLQQQEAEQRVTTAFDTAKNASETARRSAILTGFLTAASLLASLGAAWLAAQGGGKHRDEGTSWRGTPFRVPGFGRGLGEAERR